MTCPACHGRGSTATHVFVQRGATRVGEWRDVVCVTCKGAGNVTGEQMHRVRIGREMVADRRRRMATLSEEAKRLGISPRQLLAIERGVVLEGAKP